MGFQKWHLYPGRACTKKQKQKNETKQKTNCVPLCSGGSNEAISKGCHADWGGCDEMRDWQTLGTFLVAKCPYFAVCVPCLWN